MSANDTASGADQLLAEWEERAVLAILAFNSAADRSRFWDRAIGVAAVALTTAVGTSVFASLQTEISSQFQIVVGLVTLLAALLSALQTFAPLEQGIEDYRRAARRYSALRRHIEHERLGLARAGDQQEVLRRVSEQLAAAADESPNAPRSIYQRERRRIKGQSTSWERLILRVRGLR